MIYPLTRSTTLLFLFRVYALYNHNKYVVALFTLSWLLSLGLSVHLPIGTSAVHIGMTKYCILTKAKLSTSFVIFYPLVHETLVFSATAWALLGNSYIDINFTNGFKVVVMGKFLPAFSKSFLHDGQAFFLFDLIVIITFSVSYYDQKVPRSVIAFFGTPALVLVNNLSCYIYRNVRFGVYRDYSIRTSAINKALESPIPPLDQSSSLSNTSRREPTETSFVQTRSARSLDQDDTGTQVGGELYELRVR